MDEYAHIPTEFMDSKIRKGLAPSLRSPVIQTLLLTIEHCKHPLQQHTPVNLSLCRLQRLLTRCIWTFCSWNPNLQLTEKWNVVNQPHLATVAGDSLIVLGGSRRLQDTLIFVHFSSEDWQRTQSCMCIVRRRNTTSLLIGTVCRFSFHVDRAFNATAKMSVTFKPRLSASECQRQLEQAAAARLVWHLQRALARQAPFSQSRRASLRTWETRAHLWELATVQRRRKRCTHAVNVKHKMIIR